MLKLVNTVFMTLAALLVGATGLQAQPAAPTAILPPKRATPKPMAKPAAANPAQVKALQEKVTRLQAAVDKLVAAQNKKPAKKKQPPKDATRPAEAQRGTLFKPSSLSGWAVGGYGEMLVSTRFFGPDPSQEYKASEYRQTEVDLARVVFLIGYNFTKWLSFHTEIEFEHGGAGAAMEVEWDEFGEYELEVEKGGEIVLETAYLDFKLGKLFTVKVGHLLVPVGMISGYHNPNQFSSVHRPEGEEHLIPSTWHETGIEVEFAWRRLRIQAQVITGLDSTGFSSDRWIAGGTQRRFEAVWSNDWAVALRIDYAGVPGLIFGVSGYTSGASKNRPKRDMYDEKTRVYIGDIHARYHYGPLRLRTMGMMGWLTGADTITEKNSSLSRYLEVPRTPVGRAAVAYYFEAALDVLGLALKKTRHRLDVFIRYDGYDTMFKGPVKGGFDNPLMRRQLVTAGLNYFPHPRVVVKGEYLSRWVDRNQSWDRHQHEVNFALGFVL